MKTKQHKFKLTAGLDLVFVAGIGGLIFWFMIHYVTDSDIHMHAELLHYFHTGARSFPPNFIYYTLLEFFSFFSGKLNQIMLASGIVLTLALTAKYYITKKIILEFIDRRGLILSKQQQVVIPIVLATTLLFIFAIPDYYSLFSLRQYYLGRVVPNVWHNSTTITVFPFALWLFWMQYKVLTTEKIANTKQLLGLSILVIINCLIKPSFIFVYIPATALFLFAKFGFRQFLKLIKYSIPLISGLLVIIALQFLIFQLQLGLLQETGSKVVLVSPFQIWKFLIPLWYIPISLLLSYTFPLLFLILYFKSGLQDKLLSYSLLLTVLGLLISIFIGEDGARAHHGNFLWQNYICCYIWMMVSALKVIEFKLAGQLKGWKSWALLSLYIIHLIAGLGYFVHMGLFGTYD